MVDVELLKPILGLIVTTGTGQHVGAYCVVARYYIHVALGLSVATEQLYEKNYSYIYTTHTSWLSFLYRMRRE